MVQLVCASLQAAGSTAVGRRGLPKPPTDAQRQRMADLSEMDEEPARLEIADVLEKAVRTLKVGGFLLERNDGHSCCHRHT